MHIKKISYNKKKGIYFYFVVSIYCTSHNVTFIASKKKKYIKTIKRNNKDSKTNFFKGTLSIFLMKICYFLSRKLIFFNIRLFIV